VHAGISVAGVGTGEKREGVDGDVTLGGLHLLSLAGDVDGAVVAGLEHEAVDGREVHLGLLVDQDDLHAEVGVDPVLLGLVGGRESADDLERDVGVTGEWDDEIVAHTLIPNKPVRLVMQLAYR